MLNKTINLQIKKETDIFDNSSQTQPWLPLLVKGGVWFLCTVQCKNSSNGDCGCTASERTHILFLVHYVQKSI